jgi:multicomponent Na+:H+ antiporter subunit G
MNVLAWIGLVCVWIGVLLVLLTGIGLIRMPDTYMRMHASTKAGTLGMGMIALGVALELQSLEAVLLCTLLLLFFALTAPVAAHLIGRAAHISGVPVWEQTVRDEYTEGGGRAAHWQDPPAPR